jgi:acetolactate synthase I/II/III large subunit
MNGAESVVGTLIEGGVDTCFTNPGTSEMDLVAALDKRREIRCVLGLFEGAVTAAADGYARMAGRAACTLLHLGPGLANGLANLHNAHRAHVPLLNLVGQHPLEHLRYETPLASDVEAIARPYSKWLRTTKSSAVAGRDAAEAVAACYGPPKQIATLIIPADAAWSDGGVVSAVPARKKSALPATETIETIARILRARNAVAFVLGGSALYGKGLAAASRVAAVSKAKLFSPYPFSRMQRGAGVAVVDRIPYVAMQAAEALKEFKHLILVGVAEPRAYFASPKRSARLAAADCEIHTLANVEEDCDAALESLADALQARKEEGIFEKSARPALPSGTISPAGLADVIAALLPEQAIVVDESMTAGRGIMAAARGAGPHDWLANPGGSIGIALPLAVGAAVASPDRRVLCLTADGSAMYTLQALWTMARQGLKITIVVFANRAYSILKYEFKQLEIGEPGQRAKDLFEIGRPDLDWVALAKGMGVPGARANNLDDFAKELRSGFASDGPMLIEVPL